MNIEQFHVYDIIKFIYNNHTKNRRQNNPEHSKQTQYVIQNSSIDIEMIFYGWDAAAIETPNIM